MWGDSRSRRDGWRVPQVWRGCGSEGNTCSPGITPLMSLSGFMRFFCVKRRISFFADANWWVAMSHRRDSGKILQRDREWVRLFPSGEASRHSSVGGRERPAGPDWVPVCERWRLAGAQDSLLAQAGERRPWPWVFLAFSQKA